MKRQLISKEYSGTRHMLNPQREYVSAASTDIRSTFERIKAEQQVQPKQKIRRVR